MLCTAHFISHSLGFTAVFPSVFKNGSPLRPNNFEKYFHISTSYTIIIRSTSQGDPARPMWSWSLASCDAAVPLLPDQLPLPSTSYQSSLESLVTFGSLESLCWTTSLACSLDNLMIRKYIFIYILYIYHLFQWDAWRPHLLSQLDSFLWLSPFQELFCAEMLWYIVLALSDWFPFSLPENSPPENGRERVGLHQWWAKGRINIVTLSNLFVSVGCVCVTFWRKINEMC